MEGLIKNKIFLFSVVLNVSLFVFALASCGESQRQQQIVDKEILQRLEAEEKLNNVTRQLQGFQGRIDAVRKELEAEKASPRPVSPGNASNRRYTAPFAGPRRMPDLTL